MKIIEKEVNHAAFEELKRGDVFYDYSDTEEYYMKTVEALYEEEKVNAVHLETGGLVFFYGYDVVKVMKDAYLVVGD